MSEEVQEPEAPEEGKPEQAPKPITEGRRLTILTDGNGYTADWDMGLLELKAILEHLHPQVCARIGTAAPARA